MHKSWLVLGVATLFGMGMAHAADSLIVPMQLLDADGNQDVGQVVVTSSDYGLVFTPDLKGLKPGVHGFHVHENPDCSAAEKDGEIMLGGAAGGHLDPEDTGKHGHPWTDDNHLGDLPALTVDADGNATQPVLAPRLESLDDVKGHALMVHEGGDNYSDEPEPLGGGGARMACGVIK